MVLLQKWFEVDLMLAKILDHPMFINMFINTTYKIELCVVNSSMTLNVNSIELQKYIIKSIV